MKLETTREKQIDAYIATNDVKETDDKMRVVLKGQPKMLEVYRIPIRFLIYNIRNGRFAAELLAKESELKRKLDAANLRQLKQRIVLRCTLNPLTREQTHEYIDARLTRAGMADQTLFSLDVIDAIYTRASGIPRVINALCDNLLVTAFAMEQRTTTLEMLDEICSDMRLDWPRAGRERLARSRFETAVEQEPLSRSSYGD